MATVLPIEIARTITGCIEDKKTFLNLLLTTHAFRLLAEPYLYTDVHFPVPLIGLRQLDEAPSKADLDLWAMGHSFLQGITTGGDRCARYVKRLHLPDVVFLRREQYTLFQKILRLIPNLEDFQVHSQQWPIVSRKPSFNLQTLLEDSQSQTSPPPFVLHSFGWNTCRDLDDAGLSWFLSHQTSLERLFLPSLIMSDSSLPIATLPRLRVLHARDHVAARRLLAKVHVTHLKLSQGNIHELGSATLCNVVVSALPPFGFFAQVALLMPNLECFEIFSYHQSIPAILQRLGILKSATKLRYLRISSSGITQLTNPIETWAYDDVDTVFSNLPSLTHIIVQCMPILTFPEYCFARRAPRPVKLRSKRAAPEWWRDDWIEDYVVVPFEPSDPRMGYTGDLLDAAGEVLPVSVDSALW